MSTNVEFWKADDREDYELQWLSAQESREIDQAFKRARLRGLLRRALAVAGIGLPARDPVSEPGSRLFELRLGDLAGLAGEAGSRGLPVLPRGLAAAWRQEWLRAAVDEALEPFMLRQHSGYWYLEGGLRELIRLEALRARGESTIAARARTARPRPRLERVAACCPGQMDGDRIAS